MLSSKTLLQIRVDRFDSGTRLHFDLNQWLSFVALRCDTKWDTSPMMLSSYLSPSRHGVYYFRWPLPASARCSGRGSLRLSLRKRCPNRAGDLARYLASCGRLIRDNRALAGLRRDEIREKVQAYFKAQLDQYIERLERRGLSK